MKLENLKWAIENLTDATWEMFTNNVKAQSLMNTVQEALEDICDFSDCDDEKNRPFVRTVVYRAFDWSHSFEGHDFWYEQAEALIGLTENRIESMIRIQEQFESLDLFQKDSKEDEWSCGCNILGGHVCGKIQGAADRSAGMKFPIR